MYSVLLLYENRIMTTLFLYQSCSVLSCLPSLYSRLSLCLSLSCVSKLLASSSFFCGVFSRIWKFHWSSTFVFFGSYCTAKFRRMALIRLTQAYYLQLLLLRTVCYYSRYIQLNLRS